MKLSDLRTNVRRQTETEADELPDSTIDWYLQQAFDRQMAHENDWPFFEKSWDLTLVSGESTITTPDDLNTPSIQGLKDRGNQNARLMMVDHDQADGWFGGVDPAATAPAFYSVWGGLIHLWPTMSFAADRIFTLRGYRLPVDWVSLGPDAEPDCDARLHAPMIHYAVALAYAQQEDEQLETVYMQRWQMDFTRIASSIMEPVHQRPLTMGPRHITPIGYGAGFPYFTIDTSGVT